MSVSRTILVYLRATLVMDLGYVTEEQVILFIIIGILVDALLSEVL